jgi:chitinase
VQRRISPSRVVLGVLIIAGLAAGGVFGLKTFGATSAAPAVRWQAGYVDVAATPSFEFESQQSQRTAVLAFIVSTPDSACVPSWGGAYSLDAAADQLDLDRRIARLKQQGGGIAVSFGGLLNDELAVRCTDASKLFEAYASVVNRYETDTVDLDIEGAALTDSAAGLRRATAIAALQKARVAAGRELKVWLTLPAAPVGLTQAGTTAIAQLLEAGVDLTGVNAMTMDYGAAKPKDQSMGDASIQTLMAVHAQFATLLQAAGLEVSDSDVWRRMGATPMIGVNDDRGEVFTLEDAATLNRFAQDRSLGRMSLWSANRDRTCTSNYVDLDVVSDSCSGVDQGDVKFADILGSGFDGVPGVSATARESSPSPSSPASAISARAREQPVDDPATSPYRVWGTVASYAKGTKVVWHHNVYIAKWWSSGDLPDDPVVESTNSPWALIGPVLPGDKPEPLPTVPAHLYAAWSDSAEYVKGTRVVFNGVAFAAKWWNKATSPEAAAESPDSSPWAPLSQAEIDADQTAAAKR